MIFLNLSFHVYVIKNIYFTQILLRLYEFELIEIKHEYVQLVTCIEKIS